jgi:hypothetical protein
MKKRFALVLFALPLLLGCADKNPYTLSFVEGDYPLTLLTYSGKGSYARSDGKANLKKIEASLYRSDEASFLQNLHDLAYYQVTFTLKKAAGSALYDLPLHFSMAKVESSENVYPFTVPSSENPFEGKALEGRLQFFSNYFVLSVASPSVFQGTFTHIEGL